MLSNDKFTFIFENEDFLNYNRAQMFQFHFKIKKKFGRIFTLILFFKSIFIVIIISYYQFHKGEIMFSTFSEILRW